MGGSSCGRWIFREVTAPLLEERETIGRALAEICADYLPSLDPTVAETIRYALSTPGKRIRPVLLLCAYRACGGTADVANLACAVEIIHAYSLVHDDLPCMDDDDVRRGRPTVHKVYGARQAIVAGVAMIPLAVMVARDAARHMGLSTDARANVLRALLEAAGISGMIGGQARDLSGEGLSLSLEQREEIHRSKTGALIVASLLMGARAANAGQDQVHALENYGRAIGLAFQIMDDVLDVTSTTVALGKTAGRDVALGKSTYPALMGVEGAKARADHLVAEGLQALERARLLTHELSQVANFIVRRTS
jgi:geranylgeranyl diphosphate synthase type II